MVAASTFSDSAYLDDASLRFASPHRSMIGMTFATDWYCVSVAFACSRIAAVPALVALTRSSALAVAMFQLSDAFPARDCAASSAAFAAARMSSAIVFAILDISPKVVAALMS